MAHQNLKFQVNPRKSEVWQPVFGGQMHGTFFMIYIKIQSYEQITENNKIKHQYTCDFKLQNFRGAITMGLSKVNVNTAFEEVKELEEHGPILHFDLDVKPFHKCDEIFGTDIIIEKPITEGLIAVTKVNLKNPPPNIFNSDDLDNSLYINPYTHFRDGDEYDEVSRRPAGSEDDFPNPSNMGGVGTGFCLADILIFILGL